METISIDGRVISRQVSRDLDLAPLATAVPEISSLPVLVLPLIKRDKDALVDNLDVRHEAEYSILPRAECQEIARAILKLEWDALEARTGRRLPASALQWFQLVPELPVVKSESARTKGFELLGGAAAGVQPELAHFRAWVDFFVTNHIIWIAIPPPPDGRTRLVYSHDAHYVTDRKSAGTGLRGQMRVDILALRGSQSYHFRMSPPVGHFARSQRIIYKSAEPAASETTAVTGEAELPYVHLYAGGDVARSSIDHAWASIRFWEAPPWSSTDAAGICAVSITATLAVCASSVLPGIRVAPGAASLILSLPAAAALWFGAPTARKDLVTLPRLSRVSFTLIGVLAILAAIYVAGLSAKLDRVTSGRPLARLLNPYTVPLYAVIAAEIFLLGVNLRRTLKLRAGSRILRHGRDYGI